MTLRLTGVLLGTALLLGCASPEYVIEDSELPLFLGHGNLLTARKGSQEVNVRRMTEDEVSLRQTWLDPLSPEGRSFHFDPALGHLLSVGALPESEHPRRAGSPRQRREVRDQLLDPDASFSLRSWPEGKVLTTRSTRPGLARNPTGTLLLRASREARYELYSTVDNTVVARGPTIEIDPEPPGGRDEAAPPSLSGACFMGPDRFAYAWKGTVYLGRFEGGACHEERLSAGDALAHFAGKLYVLVGNRWLRGYELESRRPLWQSEVSDLGPGAPWGLSLSPDGGTLAVVGGAGFLVFRTTKGQRALGPVTEPGFEFLASLQLSNTRCVARYEAWDTSFGRQQVRVWDYARGPQAALFTRALERGRPAMRAALSEDGKWLALSRGSSVEVWRLP